MTRLTSPGVVARTQEWLEGNFDPGIIAATGAGRVFAADGSSQRMSRYTFGRLLRKLKLLRWMDALEPASFLDAASGWEHFPYLAHQRYGADGYYSDLVHRLNVPLDGEVYGKQDHAVTLQLPVLPFQDGAFDVVLCSEVLEHLVRPVEAIAELARVARRYVILTSLEARSNNFWNRWQAQWRVDTRQPHVERNFFLLHELRALFGPLAHIENLHHTRTMPADVFAPEAEQEAAYARLGERDSLRQALQRAVSDGGLGEGSMGILVVMPVGGAPAPGGVRPERDAERADWLIDNAVFEEGYNESILARCEAIRRDPSRAPTGPDVPRPDRPVATALAALLRCPDCRGAMAADGPAVVCRACAGRFAADYSVPILFPTRPGAEPTLAESLDRLCGNDRARRRIVKRMQRRLRRYERPPGLLRRTLFGLG